MNKITKEIIANQRKVVNDLDFSTQRKEFDIEFEKLSEMNELYNDQNPVSVPNNWCESDGKWCI